MVGVPKSTGCHLCIRRRVKCDGAEPACGNCVKYGATCPGYDRSFKFVAGKHQVRKRQSRTAAAGGGYGGGGGDGASSAPSTVTTTASVIVAGSSPSTSTQSETTRSEDLVLSVRASHASFTMPSSAGVSSTSFPPRQQQQQQQQPWTASQSWLPLTCCPRESCQAFICQAIDSLCHSNLGEDLFVFKPWFARVPPYIGNKTTLDVAMAAFTVHLLGKARHDGALLAKSRALYGQALRALQRSLNHAVEWRSSEVLCATMVLGIFELFAGTVDTDSWMKHATGVSWLMQQRGPQAHKNSFDLAMLLSFRPIIIMHTMFSGQDCFLAKKGWRDVLADAPVVSGLSQPLHVEMQKVMDRYLDHLARVPAVLHRGWALREARRHGMPVDRALVSSLTRHAERLHADFLTWFARFQQLSPAPVEVPPQDPGSVHDTVLAYASPWLGCAYMGYWASMLIVQEVLRQCRRPAADQHDALAEANRRFAADIFRSVETVGAGYMGPYRVGYSVRIAYEFADVRTQSWLMTLLARFEKHYAATSTQGYPKPGSSSVWAE